MGLKGVGKGKRWGGEGWEGFTMKQHRNILRQVFLLFVPYNPVQEANKRHIYAIFLDKCLNVIFFWLKIDVTILMKNCVPLYKISTIPYVWYSDDC